MKLEDLPVIELSGSPYNRGLIHGESMAGKIRDIFGGWQHMVEKTTGLPVKVVAEEFIRTTQFTQVMQKWTPELLTEVEGIATASNIDPDALFMFNCTDENAWYLERRQASIGDIRGCSSFACRDHDNLLIGQNMDIPGVTEGYQVLLHVVDHEHEAENLLFSLVGLLGMIGLSTSPIGVVNNSLKQLCCRTDGLPVNMVVRGLLMQPDFASARSFIESVPHATGHNYIIADTNDMAMYECSANQVRRVTHPQNADCLVHTNHPLSNSDLTADTSAADNMSSSNTHCRLEVLEDALLKGGSFTVKSLQSVLGSHKHPDEPVCRHITRPGASFTAGSVIYDMQTPKMLLAPGPPCETDFGEYLFKNM